MVEYQFRFTTPTWQDDWYTTWFIVPGYEAVELLLNGPGIDVENKRTMVTITYEDGSSIEWRIKPNE